MGVPLNKVKIETGRKREEENLRRFATVVRDSNDAITIQDFEGRITAWNHGAELMYGYSEEEALRKNIWLLTPSDKVEEQKDFTRRLIAGEKITSLETQRKTKDGRILDVWMTVTKLVDDAGKPIGIVSTERNITERKKAEKSLQESEAKYRAFFEASAEGILIADLETKIFKYANPSICRMLGYTENELITLSVADIHPKDALQSVFAEFEAQARGEKILAESLPCLRKGGAVFYADVNAVKIIIDGKACNAGFFRDITERRLAEAKREKLEEQLRQSQKLEAIGQLSGGIAHDFNNQLGVIMGYAELTKRSNGNTSDLERYVQQIVSACTKAAGLTRQLLSFARKAPVELRKIDLNGIIKSVVEVINRTIDRRIEIILDVQEQPANILGDWNQLENAFLNIAINARDAMPEGGRLSITLKNVDLNRAALPEEDSEIIEGPYVRISIADTGTGMSKEVMEHLFEPFFTTKQVGKGTGLGLASVYGCIKQHFGYITYESQVGKGTEFTMYLPLTKSIEVIESVKGEEAIGPGTGTLLLVDDETIYHEIMVKLFGGLGYTVHCCADGAEAVAFYRERKSAIRVVILDMNMPRMNGLQCFRSLKEINPGVKVIVTSGYGDSREFETMRKEGVCAFVQKPYRTAELAKKIAELTAS